MREVNTILKRGFLKGDYKFFHITDKNHMEFEAHGHDFYKIIFFIKGNVNYLVEARNYKLEPGDILFIGCNEIHKPFINGDCVYERVILWVNSRFLKENSTEKCNLSTVFEYAVEEKYNLLKLKAEKLNKINSMLASFEIENNNNKFGSELLKKSLIVQLIIYLTREFVNSQTKFLTSTDYNKSIIEVIEYINQNIYTKLSIDDIVSKFYISKYHLMHSFKKETGYTIHNYIVQKRLILSNNYIKQGIPILDIPYKCGFSDYSNFARTYKKMFGISPKQYYKEYYSK